MKERRLQAKIVRHAEGLGLPTPELVQQRAKEIAKIAGRNHFTEQDWQQAKVELHGGNIPPTENGDDQMLESVSERDMVAGSVGHHTENVGLEDDMNIVEELVSEGMEEAVHDQMLEASKNQDEADEG
jgi:hypothetical protein